MKLQTSLDWKEASAVLIEQMHTAPKETQKDLAKMVANIGHMVDELGQLEVELRRNKKTHSRLHNELLTKIDEAINQYEQWVMLAHLTK